MLDPRYKNVIFSPIERMTAHSMIMKELENIQDTKPASNNNSPPAKRAKSNNWMASMLEDLSERNDLEEPELKKIEEISLSLIICF